MPGGAQVPEGYFRAADAIVEIFRALREHAPGRFQQLRDLPGDDVSAARAWASDNNLNSEAIVYCAAEQRRWWRLRPDKAADLELGGGWESPVVVRIWSDATEHWLQQNTNRKNLPRPGESLTRWSKRARALYVDLAGLQPVRKSRAKRSLDKHCRWLVRLQLGDSLKAIAADEPGGVDRSAIESETTHLAKLLDLQRRRRPRGRPRQM
jgi:hypothetical protein